jgi:nicotinate-nucleotide adenylyltransferase
MKVALLGGSFNPPHVGHLLAASYVHATKAVDEVWLMPSHRHPFGKPLVDFEHRLQMCQRLADETSGWLKVSPIEREVGGEGRTVDTLEYLRKTEPKLQFVLIIGSDILKDLPYWKDFDRIRELAELLILNRPGHPSSEAAGPPLAMVSSSDIRDRLAKGNSVDALIPRRVLEYAAYHRLYV